MRGNVRPKIRPSWTTLDKLLVLAATAGLLVLLGAVPFFWRELPEKVPLHFDVAGEANLWAGKVAILILPFIGAALYAVLMSLVRVPHVYNYPVPITEKNAEGQYRFGRRTLLVANVFTTWLFSAAVFSQIAVAQGRADGLHPALVHAPLAGALLLCAWCYFSTRRQRRVEAAG